MNTLDTLPLHASLKSSRAKYTLILIVEDNEQSRRLMRDVLQHSGYRTVEAWTANEGLQLARKHRPAAVIMDIC